MMLSGLTRATSFGGVGISVQESHVSGEGVRVVAPLCSEAARTDVHELIRTIFECLDSPEGEELACDEMGELHSPALVEKLCLATISNGYAHEVRSMQGALKRVFSAAHTSHF